MRLNSDISRPRLPVWAVVKRSYGYVWRQRALLAAPLCLYLAVQIVTGLGLLGIAGVTAHLSPLLQVPIQVGCMLPTMIVAMSFSVGLHRTVLLDEVREGLAFLRWDRYLWAYMKASLIALLVSGALMAVFTAALILPLGIGNAIALFLLHPQAVYGLLFLAFLAALYIWLRVGLAFPAAALGYREVFSLSWRITAGNSLRLFLTVLLVNLPFMFHIAVSFSPIVLDKFIELFINAASGALLMSVMTVATSLNFFFLLKAQDDTKAE